MRYSPGFRQRVGIVGACLACIWLGLSTLRADLPVLLFSTGFEPTEGYDPNYELEYQMGWTGTGQDALWDNGLVSGYLPGLGQQAYIGYSVDAITQESYAVWKPINLLSIPTNFGVIEFSVRMTITDSPESQLWDDFRWSVYNANEDRLFSVDFDNYTRSINYLLQNTTNFVSTGFYFQNDVAYHLQVFMDFRRNRWSAQLDGAALVNEQPITTTNSALNLGDVDAIWVIRFMDETGGYPGENLMAFDQYEVIAYPSTLPRPARLIRPGRTRDGTFFCRVTGEPGGRYAVEVSPNLSTWTAVTTNAANAQGYFDFIDAPGAPGAPGGPPPRKFYRARLTR